MRIEMDHSSLPDQPEHFLVSMVSPVSPQKNSVYGFKIHGVCKTEEEGRKLIAQIHDSDPDFDVLLGDVGKWVPWVFDPTAVKDQVFADERLTDLLKAHREEEARKNSAWEKQLDEKKKQMEILKSKEYQEGKANEKEEVVSVINKIRQLENFVSARQSELDKFRALLEDNYSEEEREAARAIEMPELSVIPPMFV